MAAEPFNIPDLKDSSGVRWTTRDKQNLRLLMLDRKERGVSNIVKWALEEQAQLVRQRWRATAERIAREEAMLENHAAGESS